MAADTNAYDYTSSDSLWSKMNLGGMKLSTTLEKTCCKEAKTNFTYPYPFDRVMSNFGNSMQTILPITENPSWAGEEYHKPVIGKMTV